MATTVLATFLDEQLYCIHTQHLRPSMAALQDYPESVEQTRGQRQTGRNDLPGKDERVAKWMVRVKSKKC